MNVTLTAILPQGVVWWDSLRASSLISSALDGTANNAKGLLQGVTSDWSPSPVFTVTGSGDERDVSTDDDRYKWVDDGTKPHWIVARRARVLRFATDSSPKTLPGVLSRRGGKAGENMIFRRRVHHPGIRARHLSERVRGFIQPNLERRIDTALSRLAGGT